MDLVIESFKQLYPEKEFKYVSELNYSRKFKPYNANVKLINQRKLIFNFSNKWKEVNEEIQIGLIQELLVKILKEKRKTINMELYNIFIKKLNTAVPKIHSDSVLESSFNRVNETYFNGMVEKPNLRWGKRAVTKLGSYEYPSDMIVISEIFKEEQELLDYIMYHEILHKWLKFYDKNGRSIHHSPEFRKREKRFDKYEETEMKLKKFILGIKRKSKRQGLFGII